MDTKNLKNCLMEEGRFTVEAFVWENISNPDPLADIIKTSVRVSQ